VNDWLESAAVIVQETHAPEGQQRDQHEQPDRRVRRAGCRLGLLRCRGFVRIEVHFTTEFVVCAAGALVAAGVFVETLAVATVIGVSKMTVSARRLSRYATSCLASSVGTISQPGSVAKLPASFNASGDGSRPIFRFSNRKRYGGITDLLTTICGL